LRGHFEARKETKGEGREGKMKGREKDGRNKFIDIECNANAIVFFSFLILFFSFLKGSG